jgi:hypothetical protein
MKRVFLCLSHQTHLLNIFLGCYLSWFQKISEVACSADVRSDFNTCNTFFKPFVFVTLHSSLSIVPTSEEVLRMSLVLHHCCFKKIKKKLNLKIWTVYFHSPRFGFNYGCKTELYSVPFPDLWKGFFCVCLFRPIFLKNILPISNWSTLLSDLMASSILELTVGWTSSVGCTQPVVNLYTSCQGRSTKASTEFKTLWRKVTTLRGYTRRWSMRSTTEWGFFSAERLSDNGGQTIEQSRRAMYFRGLRGGSTGSLLCNAITEGNVLSGSQRG